MIVQPGLLSNPKYLALEAAVGEQALHVLVKLWTHCQKEQRGGNWGPVGRDYVLAVAGWAGKSYTEKRRLWNALLRKAGPTLFGFVWLDEAKNVVIHDWDKENAYLKANWVNGKNGGRPSGTGGNNGNSGGNGVRDVVKPSKTHGLTSGEPTGKPPPTDGEPIREDKIRGTPPTPSLGGLAVESASPPDKPSESPPCLEVSLPTLEEVLAVGKLMKKSEEDCRAFWAYYEGSVEVMNGRRFWVTNGEKSDNRRIVTNWRAKLMGWSSGGGFRGLNGTDVQQVNGAEFKGYEEPDQGKLKAMGFKEMVAQEKKKNQKENQ